MKSLMSVDYIGNDAIRHGLDCMSNSSQHSNYGIKCSRCRWGGCDIRITSCGCSYHARCMPLQTKSVLKYCPTCNTPVTGLSLIPMAFDEIDEANKLAETNKAKNRGRKRKNSLSLEDLSATEEGAKSGNKRKRSFDEGKDNKDPSGCRTGRWTSEEIVYCDKLISFFKDGNLPLASGTKLNDFLASMLKSKQSRLTKKMKNAKLSSKIFKGTHCFITDTAQCSEFSETEERFFQAIPDLKERAELKFHMRKEWREMFSNFCLQIGQPIDADAWLSSVEEMDRRVSIARDASRIARRKLMMGYALCQDFNSAGPGIFIERSQAEIAASENNEPLTPNSEEAHFNTAETDEVLALLQGDFQLEKTTSQGPLGTLGEGFDEYDMIGKSSLLHASPFLSKVMAYVKRHNVPFEHVDVWVPNAGSGENSFLGFAGCATTDSEIPSDGKVPATSIDTDDRFHLLAFGDYSQKFSFAEGCGLPGRIFSSGVPVWEEEAFEGGFERSGGAIQWGIKSVVGIPIASPNVGRIVICLYSRHERPRDDGLIKRLQNEFTKLLPTPKWKLVIDMSTVSSSSVSTDSSTAFPFISGSNAAENTAEKTSMKQDHRVKEMIDLLGQELSSNMLSASGDHVQSLTGLRLFLLKSSFSPAEEETVGTLVGSYSSYMGCGRSKGEVATMLCRDFSFLTQAHQTKPALTVPSYNDFASVPLQQYTSVDQANAYTTPTFGQLPNYNISTSYGSVAATSEPADLLMSHYYPIQEAGLENFRSASPTLTPILPYSGSGTNGGDNLSVVSN